MSRFCTRLRATRRYISTTPTSNTKPYYVTTPIFYPNASPHIGHLYSLVAGDVFTRYQRLRKGIVPKGLKIGKREEDGDVQFLAGTDEHGMKIQKASMKHFGVLGKEKEFCDSISPRFRTLGEKALVTNTCFIRTTSPEHRRTVEGVWNQLRSKGYIYKARYSGWYSVTDESFYSDSQVTKCGSASATSAPTIAIETGSSVEWTEEENYLFRLGAFKDDLLQHYRTHPMSIYPEQYREDVLKMLNQNDSSNTLPDISISRPRSRLKWGIQVPDDPSQTVYVWFDALLVYLTGSGYPSSSSVWPPDLQIIGKDILRFHSVYLPAILIALSKSPQNSDNTSSASVFPLARTILVHAHWTSSQKKMSKSVGNVADPLEAIDKWGADVVRFYLMRVGGRWRDDADWSPSQLEKHQKEIQAQLGNYLLRVTSPRLVERVSPGVQIGGITMENCFSDEMVSWLSTGGGLLQQQDRWVVEEDVDVDNGNDPNLDLLKAAEALPGKVHDHMETFEVGLAIEEIMDVLKLANKTLTDIAPWSPDTSPTLIHTTRIVALETLRIVGGCLEPFMPTISGKLRDALRIAGDDDGSVLQDPIDCNIQADRAVVLWDRWSTRAVTGIRLF